MTALALNLSVNWKIQAGTVSEAKLDERKLIPILTSNVTTQNSRNVNVFGAFLVHSRDAGRAAGEGFWM